MTKQLSLFGETNEPAGKKIEHANKIQVFVDGASRGNPGSAGAGILIIKNGKSKGYSFFLGKKTNNQAEYLALVLGLLQIKSAANLEIASDSELLVKQIKGEYKVRNESLQKSYLYALKLLSKFEYKIKHVLREKNEEADKLANIAIDKKVEISNEVKELLQRAGVDI